LIYEFILLFGDLFFKSFNKLKKVALIGNFPKTGIGIKKYFNYIFRQILNIIVVIVIVRLPLKVIERTMEHMFI